MTPSADSPSDPPDNDELAAQLDELEATLTDLRSELRNEEQRGPPQPPRLSELLRFTEQYTIPTLIAILEATVRSLELLRRTLRLADPERAASEESAAVRGRLDEAGSEAGRQLADALTELRTALSDADLPENAESRDLITDARELTGEIEARLRDAEQTVNDQWDRERDGESTRKRRSNAAEADDGVMIDVSDGGDDSDDSSRSPADDGNNADDDTPSVDVDAELESIKDELDEAEQAIDDAERDETPDNSTEDDDTDAT